MTVDERFEQLERKTQRLEKRNKRLTVALTLTVVAMCAVVTMAATDRKISDFDVVTARNIFVTNDSGDPVVILGTTEIGDGAVTTWSAKGKELVALGANENGGAVAVSNKTGEGIVQMGADEYGNGVVGAYNRKGMGRELKPGP
jgi:hypothetical protein